MTYINTYLKELVNESHKALEMRQCYSLAGAADCLWLGRSQSVSKQPSGLNTVGWAADDHFGMD